VFVKGTYKDWQGELYRHDDNMQGFSEHFDPATGLPPGSAFTSAHAIKQTMDVAAIRFNHSPEGAKLTYAADLSWSHRFGMHCAGCHALPENPTDFGKPENHGYQAIGDFRLGVKMIPGHDIMLGAEFRRLDRGDHKKELSPAGTIASGYDKSAVYAQDQFDIIRDHLRATVGVRYDRKTDITPEKTSPRVALVFTPNNRLVMRGGYSTAFRFPTFSELYQDSWFINVTGPIATFPLAVFNPNANLRPEEIRTIEGGAEYQFTPTLSGKLDVYRSRVSKFIVITENPLPGGLTGLGWENHPATGHDQRQRGGTARQRSWTDRFRELGASDRKSERLGRRFQRPAAGVRVCAKEQVNVGAYAGPFKGFRGSIEASWRAKYVGPQFYYLLASNFTDPTVRPLPSYTLFNARASYEFAAFGIRATASAYLCAANRTCASRMSWLDEGGPAATGSAGEMAVGGSTAACLLSGWPWTLANSACIVTADWRCCCTFLSSGAMASSLS